MDVVKVLQKVITALLVAIIVVLLLVFFIPQCLGYRPYNIQTGSMEPKFPVGSMIYVKPVSFDKIAVGDVVTYHTQEQGGWTVTHRVVHIDKEKGTIDTKGDANANTIEKDITYFQIVGKATNFSVPFLGSIVAQYQSSNGKLITVILIMLLLGTSFILDRIQERNASKSEEDT